MYRMNTVRKRLEYLKMCERNETKLLSLYIYFLVTSLYICISYTCIYIGLKKEKETCRVSDHTFTTSCKQCSLSVVIYSSDIHYIQPVLLYIIKNIKKTVIIFAG